MFLIRSVDSCRERVQLFGAGVGADSRLLEHHREAEKRQNDRHEPHHRMEPVPRAGLAAGPVPPAQEHHVQVEHRHREPDKVKQARQGDHPRAEILELRRDRPAFELPPPAPRSWRHRAGPERSAPRRKAHQDERHGHIRRQERRDHPDRDQERSHQPVAEIGGEQDAEIGLHPAAAG